MTNKDEIERNVYVEVLDAIKGFRDAGVDINALVTIMENCLEEVDTQMKIDWVLNK